MSGDALYLDLVVSFALTVFGYLSIPMILSILGKKYEIKKIKRINTLNCVVVWILFRVLQITLTGEATSGAAVFLWGAVGQWILKKNCLEESKIESSRFSDNLSQTSNIHVCVSNGNEIPQKYGRNEVPLSDLALKQDTTMRDTGLGELKERNVKQTQQENNMVERKFAKYCSRCGEPIDPTTKQCLGCGKQYFKGISWKKVLCALLTLMLISSLVLNVVFYITCKEIVLENSELISENEALTKTSSKIQKENESLEKELRLSYKQFDNINELVVFVEDDGTRLYHKFLCEKFKGESFWAFNIDAAEGKGYKPCTLCSNADYSTSLTWIDSFTQLLIETIVGEDYEISTDELKNLSTSSLASLISNDVVLTCSSWKGLYHSITCERLTGICTVRILPAAKADGFRPCPMCQN